MQKILKIYERADGSKPFWDWLLKLRDKKGRGVISARLERLEMGNFGDCKSIGAGIYELKVNFGPGYRVYFGQDGENIVILFYGGDKSTQTKDIKKAQEFWKEYKNAN